ASLAPGRLRMLAWLPTDPPERPDPPATGGARRASEFGRCRASASACGAVRPARWLGCAGFRAAGLVGWAQGAVRLPREAAAADLLQPPLRLLRPDGARPRCA